MYAGAPVLRPDDPTLSLENAQPLVAAIFRSGPVFFT